MKHILFNLVFLTLVACAINPLRSETDTNTDLIAGYWSGEVTGVLDNGEELPSKSIGILIKAGCTVGNPCGKLSEDGYCPGDIILLKVDGNRYSFLSETVSGTQHICGVGDMRQIDLVLRSDGKILFDYKNGAIISGVLQK